MYVGTATYIAGLMSNSIVKPFLKWAGNKAKLIPYIRRYLPTGSRLVEPFVGSGAVFLNSEFDRYLLNDINPDLINVYQILQRQGLEFIYYAKSFFIPENNSAERYYHLRTRFNQHCDPLERAALFIYLNRHGYNGLCRYNSQGLFNVPFGLYKKPYFPFNEMLIFYRKAKHAVFICEHFLQVFKRLRRGNVIYCDPPYVPLSTTAYFTQYSQSIFGSAEQILLANMVKATSLKGIPVLLSNHDTPLTRQLYQDAEIFSFSANRYISCKADQRKPVQELLAIFQ